MNPESSAPARGEGALRIVLPIALLALGVLIWDLVVRLKCIPPYVLPGPGLVFTTLVSDWPILSESLLVTLVTTFEGFLLAFDRLRGNTLPGLIDHFLGEMHHLVQPRLQIVERV